MLKNLILLILIGSFSIVHAEVYTWVDENGVKHFDEKIPEKYQQQAEEVEINTRQPTADEVAAANDRVKRMQSVRLPGVQQPDREKVKSKQINKKKYASEYDRNMAEYRESQACFAKCGKRVIGRGTIDNSACGHCKSVPQPQK